MKGAQRRTQKIIAQDEGRKAVITVRLEQEHLSKDEMYREFHRLSTGAFQVLLNRGFYPSEIKIK